MKADLRRRLLQHSPHSPAPHRTFRLQMRALLLAWFALCAITALMIVLQSIWANEKAFSIATAQLDNQVTDRAFIAETALEGFSAFVMSKRVFEHEIASDYARTLLSRYPFLYMFEVAKRVEHEQRADTESALARIYPGFTIRSFDFEHDRRWREAPIAEYYYPIIFQEPYYRDEREIVGLDLHSSEDLIAAMRESFRVGAPVATRPFRLAEDAPGYVIHRPLDGAPGTSTEPLTATRYALLALRADRLFGTLPVRHPTIAVSLEHPDNSDSDAHPIRLIETAGQPSTALERLLLPSFEHVLDLADTVTSQPFRLTTTWQLTWGDTNLPQLFLLMVFALLVPLFARRFAIAYFEDRLADMDSAGALYQMANFDALTGVANRYRLMEQLEIALLRAQRDKHSLCVLFVDIDGFKTVNDRYGHAGGDAVLVDFAHRMTDLLRGDEVFGRLGGDEFIIVTNDASEFATRALINRIRRDTERPTRYKGAEIEIKLSTGYACYPTDGSNIAALLETADQRMYQKKRSRG